MIRCKLIKTNQEHVLDEGLPDGQTRDGPWNTNNWVEASFRTFNAVFLENRKNKRYVLMIPDSNCDHTLISILQTSIDRLLSIILDDFFMFYQFWGPGKARPDKKLVNVFKAGHDLWSSGHVFPCQDGHGALSSTKFEVISRRSAGR
jgi:hypothetical protein